MAGKKRVDSNGRVLKDNELQRKQDGRYMYRYIDPTGKKKVAYALTLPELREKEKKIAKDLQDGINTAEAEKTTLNQLFTMYMNAKVEIRDSTRENYLMMWRNNVQDSFLGNMKISAIKPMHIDNLYAEFSRRGLAKNSIKLIHNLLKPCLQKAVDNDLIRKNPANQIGKITGTKTNRNALTIEQQERFLAFVRGSSVYNVYYPMLVAALGTALRIGELTGLTWDDIDLKANIINVNHQLCYKKKDGKIQFCISELKTDAGQRKIPLTSETRKALFDQKALYLALGRSSQAEIDGKTNFVFITKNGTPFATNAINFVLKNIVEAYNRKEKEKADKEHRKPELLPHISAHILRHTGCTRMAERGVDPKTLQYIMGHADIKVTMEVYNHADDARVKKEMQKAEGIIQYG